MLTTLQSTFESNKGLKAVTDLPALVKAQSDLAAVTAEIAGHLEDAAVPPGASPATTLKATLLANAIDACAELAAAVHACAVDNGDAELAAASDYSASDLRAGREPEVVARCARVVSQATEVAEDLDDYGYSAQDVAAVGKAVEAFARACPAPRQHISARSASNKAVPKLIRKAQRILATRIDKLALQLRKTAPNYYSEYRAARKVMGQAGAPGAVASAPTATELKKAA